MRLWALFSVDVVWWNGVDEVEAFGMFTALVEGGFCPGLDDIS